MIDVDLYHLQQSEANPDALIGVTRVANKGIISMSVQIKEVCLHVLSL